MDITVDNRKQVDYGLENKFTVDKGIKESELCLLDVSTKMDPEEDELVRDIIDQVRNNPEDIREQLISAPAECHEVAVQELARLEGTQVDSDWVIELTVKRSRKMRTSLLQIDLC